MLALHLTFPVNSLHLHSECFYHKNGKWYYAGTYNSFRLGDLTVQEWDKLSTEVGYQDCPQSDGHSAYHLGSADYADSRERHSRRSKKYVSSKRLRDDAAICCWCSESSLRRLAMHRVQQHTLQIRSRPRRAVRVQRQMAGPRSECRESVERTKQQS